MSEYIDREKLKTDFDDKAYYISHGQYNLERGMTLYGINQMIDEQQPANVVECAEYEKLKKENVELKIKYDDAEKRCCHAMDRNAKLRSKIDKVIEEIEKTENTQEHTSYDGDINIKGAFNDGMEKALEILKRNIGE